MDHLRQDLAFGIRAIGRRPGFTVLAASMLALGIGANTAIFSVVNAVVLRPLSYHAPEELFFVGAHRGERLQAFSAPEFLALPEQARGFEKVATAIEVNLNLVGEGEPERSDPSVAERVREKFQLRVTCAETASHRPSRRAHTSV